MSIFERRIAVKPYQYPELLTFMRAIRESSWFIDEYKESLSRDINDYNNHLTDAEKSIITKTLLAISQIEVSVKTFWAKVGDNLPKPEIYMVGYTLANNEVVHQEAYGELITALGLEEMFKDLVNVPQIAGRIEYLTKYIRGAAENTRENYTLNLLLFSAFIESCSLFSQFFIIKSFNEKKQLLKTIDNIVMATAKEEDVHFQFGVALINIIKKENPEWFNEEFDAKIYRACKKAFDAEVGIINWIFSEGETEYLTKDAVIEFIKTRFNSSLEAIALKPLFTINKELIAGAEWFESERILDVRPDFFDIQSPNYTTGNQEISAESLF